METRIKKIEKRGKNSNWKTNSISVTTNSKTNNEPKYAVNRSVFKSVISYSETVANILEKKSR